MALGTLVSIQDRNSRVNEALAVDRGSLILGVFGAEHLEVEDIGTFRHPKTLPISGLGFRVCPHEERAKQMRSDGVYLDSTSQVGKLGAG